LSIGDQMGMAFMGTTIASGRATGVVVATGSETQLGQIAGEMRTTKRAETPLQERTARFGVVISVIVVAASLLVFLVGLWRGADASDMFLVAVAVAVSAIPEGLPAVMTVALAVSVRRMARRKAIV